MTSLFPDPSDGDHDEAPRLRHWCADPSCSRCDEIAELEAERELEACRWCEGKGEVYDEDEGVMLPCIECDGTGDKP